MKKIIIIFLLFSSLNFAQFEQWEYFGEMQYPVAGADLWIDGEVFYIFGGYSDSLQTNVDWVQKYRVYYDVWKIFKMSTPRFGNVVNEFNNYAYVYGGVSSDYTDALFGIEQWDSAAGFDSTIAINSNFNRNFSTGKIIGDNLYIIGGNPQAGTSSDTLPYIVEYNIPNDSITFQSDSLFLNEVLPEQQMAEVIGDDIFIFGGVINGISQDIYKFNTIDKSFIKLDNQLIEPRAGGRAIKGSDPNTIYIIGGYNENNIALNTVEVFNFNSLEDSFISYIPHINDARYNFMSAYLDGFIYIMGGFDNDGNVVKSIERYYDQATTAAVNENKNIDLNSFQLYQNYPNPFNPTTTIKYSIPSNVKSETLNVKLIVYDFLGREISTLVNEKQKPGNYEVEFNSHSGEYWNLASGIYFYQLKTDSFTQTKKMILLK